MTLYFFLYEPNIYRSRNKLKGNPRIVKFDPAMFWIKGIRTPSPSYTTPEELAKKDKRFKEFKKLRYSTALKLTEPENIIDMEDMVIATAGDDSQAGRMLMHLVEGTRASKKFSGIHHLPDPLPNNVRNLRIIEPPDKFGVYTASFEIIDSGKILQKENYSTLFPKHWSRQQLYDECLFALNNKIRVTDSSYTSKTTSGVPVEIYFDKDEKKIKTLYALRTAE